VFFFFLTRRINPAVLFSYFRGEEKEKVSLLIGLRGHFGGIMQLDMQDNVPVSLLFGSGIPPPVNGTLEKQQ